MKVAYINCLSSRRGMPGVEKKLHAQARAIQTLGLNVDVFLFDRTKRLEDSAFTFYPQGRGPVTRWLSVLGRYAGIGRRVDLSAYDRIVLRYSGGDVSALSPVFQRNGGKLVTEHHTKELPEAYTYRSSYPQRALSIFMEAFFGPRLLKRARGLIAVTDEIASYELGRIPRPIPTCTIGNGISTETIPFSRHAPFDGDRLNLLCLAGRFEPWQGLDRVFAGLARYSRPKPVLHIHVVGEVAPEHETMARGLLKEKGGNVRFYGRLEGKALEAVCRTTHLAFGSLAVFRKGLKEACPLKTREYMARGIPFVTAYTDPDLASLPDFVLPVPAQEAPVDMEKVVFFAERILRQEDTSDRMRSFAVRKLDWKIKMQKMWNFLLELNNE